MGVIAWTEACGGTHTHEEGRTEQSVQRPLKYKGEGEKKKKVEAKEETRIERKELEAKVKEEGQIEGEAGRGGEGTGVT